MGGSVRFRIRLPNAILAKSEDVDVVLLTHAGGGRINQQKRIILIHKPPFGHR
jgi:hypothetical protein